MSDKQEAKQAFKENCRWNIRRERLKPFLGIGKEQLWFIVYDEDTKRVILKTRNDDDAWLMAMSPLLKQLFYIHSLRYSEYLREMISVKIAHVNASIFGGMQPHSSSSPTKKVQKEMTKLQHEVFYWTR